MIYTNKALDDILQQQTDSPSTENASTHDGGTKWLLHGYQNTQERGYTQLVMERMPFPNELPAFLSALEQANITEFVLAEASTALMELLAGLLDNGWTVTEPWADYERRFGAVYGLVMRKST